MAKWEAWRDVGLRRKASVRIRVRTGGLPIADVWPGFQRVIRSWLGEQGKAVLGRGSCVCTACVKA